MLLDLYALFSRVFLDGFFFHSSTTLVHSSDYVIGRLETFSSGRLFPLQYGDFGQF